MYVKRLEGIFVIGGGKNDSRRMIQQFQHLKTRDFRHLNIQKDQIWPIFLNGLQSFKTVIAGFYHLKFRERKQVFLYYSDSQWLVINDNCPDHKVAGF